MTSLNLREEQQKDGNIRLVLHWMETHPPEPSPYLVPNYVNTSNTLIDLKITKVCHTASFLMILENQSLANMFSLLIYVQNFFTVFTTVYYRTHWYYKNRSNFQTKMLFFEFCRIFDKLHQELRFVFTSQTSQTCHIEASAFVPSFGPANPRRFASSRYCREIASQVALLLFYC